MFCLLLILFSMTQVISSQKINPYEAQAKLHEHFSPLRENIHLHLNKTYFLRGERIWFSAYVFDQARQIPSEKTSNLHVAIYDYNGKVISEKLIKITNGVGSGEFSLDENYSKSKYFIRAWTTWMGNFKDRTEFVQEIKIIDAVKSLDSRIKYSDTDVQIFPEGEHFVSSSLNTFAFYVSDNAISNDSIISIDLIESQNKTVLTNLALTRFNLGKASFFYKKNECYQLKVTLLSGNTFLKNLPNAINSGMNLQVTTSSPSFAYITINTNPATFEDEKGKVQFLLVHKNGESLLEEVILDSTSTTFRFSKDALFKGVNTITLFKSDQSKVSERLFFNDFGSLNNAKALNIKGQISSNRDSILLEIAPDKSFNQIDTLNISVSVLPIHSVAYEPGNSIISSFYLNPYINFFGEYPINLSEQLNREALYNLDILMIINGSGIYDWQSIQTNTDTLLYNFEEGINIHGIVKNLDLKIDSQVCFMTKNHINWFCADIAENKTYSTNNVLYTGDSLNVFVLDKESKLNKPKIDVNFGDTRNQVPFNLDELKWTSYLSKSKKEEQNIDSNTDIIYLNEVILSKKRQDKNKIVDNSADFTSRIIESTDIKKYVTITNYLRKLGFRVELDNSRVVVKSSQFPWNPIPIFINGLITDGSEIFNTPLNRVHSLSYDSFKSKGIFIQLDNKNYNSSSTHHLSFLIKNGYSPPSNYTPNNYIDFESDIFQLFGTIFWAPMLKINSYETTSLAVPIQDQEGLMIYIEGMTSDGMLFSTKKLIMVNEL